jgi:D-beta-D-heptose 7-phosphate kinase/D-beta-D-heptose 1-phosphate adenosyltransferase
MLENKSRLVILGDLMLDVWLDYQFVKTSPETGAPVVKKCSRQVSPGGAANSARIAALVWGEAPLLIGALANDEVGKELVELISKSNIEGIFFDQPDGYTTSKSRISIENTQICRIDSDTVSEINFEVENKIISTLNEIPNIGIVLLSDYDKGFLTPRLIQLVVNFAKGKRIAVVADPAIGRLELFQGVNILKPNSVAFEDYLLQEGSEISNLDCQHLIVTRGDQGVELIKSDETKTFKAKHMEGPIDVTGAGDAFAVALTYTHLMSFEIEDSIDFATRISALQVTSLKSESIDLTSIKEKLREVN